MAYCTPEEVLRALQARGLPDPGEDARSLAAQLATGLVEAYLGRGFSPDYVQVGLYARRSGTIYLPWPAEVQKVLNEWGEEVSFSLRRGGRVVEVPSSGPYILTLRWLPTEPPEEVRLVCAELAANILSAPPEFVKRLADGGLSVESSGILTPSLRSVLDKYKHVSIR